MNRVPRLVRLVALAAIGSALVSGHEASADTAIGTVTWGREVSLGLTVSGVVRTVHVEPGDRVDAGDPLLALDDRPFRIRIDELAASGDRIAPALAEARRELERAQDLYDRTLLSEHDLELAKIALARVDAEARQAAARLARARLDLASSVLRAPFAGVVVERSADLGTAVVSNCDATALASVADPTVLMARTIVESPATSGFRIGTSVVVTIGQSARPGTVYAVRRIDASDAGGVPRFAVDVRFEPEGEPSALIGARATLEPGT